MTGKRGERGYAFLPLLLLWLASLLMVGCGAPPVPKPMGYPRFDFPPRAYRLLDTVGVPFTCEIPTYSLFSMRGDGKGFDLDFPQYRATLYLTYFHAADRLALDSLFEDARRLAYKHTVRAEAIEEQFWENGTQRVWAMVYHLKGPVATTLQFYATDSLQSFLRGALYFYSKPNNDSLAPAIARYSEDVAHMVETLHWRGESIPVVHRAKSGQGPIAR